MTIIRPIVFFCIALLALRVLHSCLAEYSSCRSVISVSVKSLAYSVAVRSVSPTSLRSTTASSCRVGVTFPDRLH